MILFKYEFYQFHNFKKKKRICFFRWQRKGTRTEFYHRIDGTCTPPGHSNYYQNGVMIKFTYLKEDNNHKNKKYKNDCI